MRHCPGDLRKARGLPEIDALWVLRIEAKHDYDNGKRVSIARCINMMNATVLVLTTAVRGESLV